MPLYPEEALDYPIMQIADIIGHDLDEALFTSEASPIQGLYALALALAWRLQFYRQAERAILCDGLTGLIRVNALDLGEGD